MKVLISHIDTQKVQNAELVQVKAETQLQTLLAESLFLIPINEIRTSKSPLVFSVREFGLPGSGFTDLLAFTADGDIAIIECKLAANSDVKRKVIGQILEYAAYLRQMTYEELDHHIRRLKGQSLRQLMYATVAKEWDETQFRKNVIKSLNTGSFMLIIAVDEINEELRHIIDYINECTQANFSLHGLEIHQFQSDMVQVLVSQVYGPSPQPLPSGKKQLWTEERYFAVLADTAPNSVNIVREMHDWSKEHADQIEFGGGRIYGTLRVHYHRDGKPVSVFMIWTDGKLQLNYRSLANQVGEEIITRFHNQIHQITSFRDVQDDFSKYPSLLIEDVLQDPKHRQQFKQAVIDLGSQITR